MTDTNTFDTHDQSWLAELRHVAERIYDEKRLRWYRELIDNSDPSFSPHSAVKTKLIEIIAADHERATRHVLEWLSADLAELELQRRGELEAARATSQRHEAAKSTLTQLIGKHRHSLLTWIDSNLSQPSIALIVRERDRSIKGRAPTNRVLEDEATGTLDHLDDTVQKYVSNAFQALSNACWPHLLDVGIQTSPTTASIAPLSSVNIPLEVDINNFDSIRAILGTSFFGANLIHRAVPMSLGTIAGLIAGAALQETINRRRSRAQAAREFSRAMTDALRLYRDVAKQLINSRLDRYESDILASLIDNERRRAATATLRVDDLAYQIAQLTSEIQHRKARSQRITECIQALQARA